MLRNTFLAMLLALLCPLWASAQTRDELVRSDRDRVENDESWIYTDLPLGKRLAQNEGRPLLVIFRCIPCEACALLDEQVVSRDLEVRKIMDKFICVRIPKGNAMDLTQFQFDYDLSFQAFFMNADGTIYGRYGTRSSREDADREVSIEGFGQAMQAALRLHAGYPQNKAVLSGKQAKPTKYERPEEYPSLEGRYKEQLDFAGATAKSCLHCHQIRDAQRDLVRQGDQQWTDQVLYPYPTPDVIGLKLDPQSRATIAEVSADSPAARADLQKGDQIYMLAGQAILSAADIQWVLHHAGASAELIVLRRRGDTITQTTLKLPAGWRENSDISWRTTTWNLRRIALGGMFLESLSDEEREQLGLPDDQLALRAKHVGQYGPHALAKQAGLVKGDVIVEFNGNTRPMTETELIAHTVKNTKPGDAVSVKYLRDTQTRQTKIRLQ
jgi:serine protease Do